MTEAEWLACKRPDKMLSFCRGVIGERKRRLLAAAFCRRIWHLFEYPWASASVEAAEQYADGSLDNDLLSVALRRAREAARAPAWNQHAVCAAGFAVSGVAVRAAHHAAAALERPRAPERTAQAVLVRDVVGNLFCPVSRGPCRATPLAVSIAQAAYEERSLPSGHLDHIRLAVLADALEESDYTNEALLTHLRSPGPHVRGCWALDLILGKD